MSADVRALVYPRGDLWPLIFQIDIADRRVNIPRGGMTPAELEAAAPAVAEEAFAAVCDAFGLDGGDKYRLDIETACSAGRILANDYMIGSDNAWRADHGSAVYLNGVARAVIINALYVVEGERNAEAA